MIFTGFKRKTTQIFFNKQLVKWLNSPKTKQQNKVENVLLFVNHLEEIETSKVAISTLLNLKKEHIDVLVFQPKKQKNEAQKEIFTPQDFGWYGKVKSEHLKTVLTKKYDLLINSEKVENIYSKVLILQCERAFKIGFAHLDTRLYDLLINCEIEDVATFHKEIKKYLAILNKI